MLRVLIALAILISLPAKISEYNLLHVRRYELRKWFETLKSFEGGWVGVLRCVCHLVLFQSFDAVNANLIVLLLYLKKSHC